MPSYSDVTLATARLDLRPLTTADAPALFALKSDARVQRYGSHTPWTQHEQATAWLERDRQGMADGRHVHFGIIRREDGVMVGTCTLYDLDAQCRCADVGYALLPSAWGRGYANEAVTALLDFGFERLALNRVSADIDPRNAPSARALERLGFTREGHLRERWIVGDEVCDSWIYGLLAREWRARR